MYNISQIQLGPTRYKTNSRGHTVKFDSWIRTVFTFVTLYVPNKAMTYRTSNSPFCSVSHALSFGISHEKISSMCRDIILAETYKTIFRVPGGSV